MRRIFFTFVLMLFSGTASGATFSIPLPGLVGEVDFPRSGGKEISIDLGQQFSLIESVSIEIEAHVFASEFDVCGTALEPGTCVHQTELLGLMVQLDDGTFPPVTGFATSDGLSFYDGSSQTEGTGVAIASITPWFGWEFLLGGEADLNLFWNVNFGDPDRIIVNRVEPTGEIFSAQLIVQGTPIPEPSTTLLLATGLLTLAGIKERR